MVEHTVANGFCLPLDSLTVLPLDDFLSALQASLEAGDWPLAWFTRPTPRGREWLACLSAAGHPEIRVFRGPAPECFPSLTPRFPRMQLFERELWEEDGIEAQGHPWCKPVRFPGRADEIASYPFYRLEGDEVHEVAVGPVHAGVIEPGHFRFQCHGERVYHLEIQLGWQHRGVEEWILRHCNANRPTAAALAAETLAGDTTVGNALAHARLLESLCGRPADPVWAYWRRIALEMERVAMHLGDLAALSGDVAWLPGANWFAELRTRTINSLMLLSGSRFARGWLRPGGYFPSPPPAAREQVRESLRSVQPLAAGIAALMLETSSLRSRFERTGIVDTGTARNIGLVGPAARASGIDRDLRRDLPLEAAVSYPEPVVEPGGDVMARARVRIQELDRSLEFLLDSLADDPGIFRPGRDSFPFRFAPDSLALVAVEAWRGCLVHAAVTDRSGRLLRYRTVDPSFHNWLGLALAVRGNGISDFPLCNKSFNLSYCGFDR